MSGSVRLMLVDDHKIVRSGFKQIIELEDNLEVVCEASTIEEAKHGLTELDVDVAVIDLSLPDGNGLELLKFITSKSLHVRTVVLSMYDTDPFVTDALNLGANAYLSKRTGPDDIITAIDLVLDGQSFISTDIIINLAKSRREKDSSGVDTLTQREKEVFLLLAKGHRTKEVARIIYISPKTVHTHRRNICEKLNCSGSLELTQIALKANMLSVDDLV